MMSNNGRTSGAGIGSEVETVAVGANEFALVLPWLKSNAAVTIVLRADEFRYALEMALGGPEVMSTSQAAGALGWSTKRWRGWAEQGRVDGAVQEESGDWRLPREGCRERMKEELAAGRRPAKKQRATTKPVLHRETLHRPSPPPVAKSIRRGPRSRKAA